MNVALANHEFEPQLQDGQPGSCLPVVGSRVRTAGKFFARGGKKIQVQGVTYGPFAPAADGQPFPSVEQTRHDFRHMRDIGINSIRTYHVPPDWLFHVADEEGLTVFVDIPWSKHLCFLDSTQAQKEARLAIRRAAERGQSHPCILAYSIGNEIPTDIIRWHGSRRVEEFLAELMDVAKQTDPGGLVTYTSFPPTEYLDLSFLDFATFNVYLHDLETFRNYLFRLQNLVGDKPLLLGELGMDTLRHGEVEQASFLAGHVRETRQLGLAGVFVFSWTDDWFTGGYQIEDWAFGITHADRLPKASHHALGEIFQSSLPELLQDTPRVSVVVCTYNGGRTLAQCLYSLQKLNYPDYEIIVVNDGSTDATREILARFPDVRAFHQENMGLSVARNTGLQAATGEIVAYTDDDCFADPDWLAHLVSQLQQSGAHAVGGPNLTPEDGWLAACVAASPGQPTHVLESDQEAEHIPGCNMAFHREALLAINGFDPVYRKAGDDVDVCWRLQDAGMWITFAPGAMVWHHRRPGPRSFFRQQAGYGEAEALLHCKHPDRFTNLGNGKWRGVLYGAALQGLRLGRNIIYRGVFASGLFQCLYQSGPCHWAMLPSTLEWHALVFLVAAAGFIWPWAFAVAGIMLSLSLLVACLQAGQARLPAQHDHIFSRLIVAGLCYAQPLVRSWKRYRTYLFARRVSIHDPALQKPGDVLPWTGRRTISYWSEKWLDRTELLNEVIGYLNERSWSKAIDSGWSSWDLQIYCDRWTSVRIHTVQEDHGSGKRLLHLRFCLHLQPGVRILGGLGIVAATILIILSPLAGAIFIGLWLLSAAFLWRRGTIHAAQAVGIVDSIARQMDLVRCSSPSRRDS